MSPSTRRTLLRAAPALLAPSLFASLAQAHGSTDCMLNSDTPIIALFHEWEALQMRCEGAPAGESDLLCSEVYDLERLMATETVTGLPDLAAKLIACTDYGAIAPSSELIAEAEAILAGMLA